MEAKLQGGDFSMAIVDGSTLIWGCKVDTETNFRGVGLENARIEPETKQLLEYNIRRKSWENWYVDHRRLTWLVKPFWEISDYGLSTKQVIRTFFQFALIFAALYFALGAVDYHFLRVKNCPGIVSDLFVLEDTQEAVPESLVPFRALYFSIVTMTTLGFGDMYANAHSFGRGLAGHILLSIQVILGYVLLAALVTRFAVLFTAGGPAGKFAESKNQKN